MVARLTFRMQALRDDPQCAREAVRARARRARSRACTRGSRSTCPTDVAAPLATRGAAAVAILREQGVNGQREMAAAFDRAGFEAHDVHMSDMLARPRRASTSFAGFVACGGFSYGDVLGAGEGWAKSILFNARAARRVRARSSRAPTRFALGVCNGCQMMAALRELIPGADALAALRAQPLASSSRRACRWSKSLRAPSMFFDGMAGSRMPIAVAHGEGLRRVRATGRRSSGCDAGLSALRFVDNRGAPAERYPANPNGSPRGHHRPHDADGRVTILMPHPERVFRTVQHSGTRPTGANARPGNVCSTTRATGSTDRVSSFGDLGRPCPAAISSR